MFECVSRAEAGAAAVLVSERFGGSFVFWAGAGGQEGLGSGEFGV